MGCCLQHHRYLRSSKGDNASSEVTGRGSVDKGAADRDNVAKVDNGVRGKVSDRAEDRDEVSRANGAKVNLIPSACKNDWVRLPRSGRSWDRAS